MANFTTELSPIILKKKKVTKMQMKRECDQNVHVQDD